MCDDPIIWLNGELLPVSRASVSPLDRGFLHGVGVFETLRAYSGAPFAVAEHLERLAHGATVFELPVPGHDALEEAIQVVLQANDLAVADAGGPPAPDARLRITLSGGVAPLGLLGAASDRPTLVVSAAPLPAMAESASVLVVPFTRNPRSAIAGMKTISYAENSLALRHARQRRYDEAILADTDGNVCEGATSNVFLLVEGRLLTPPLSTGCLPGVTRALVLKAARRAGIEIFEEKVPMAALEGAEGAFLTSSLRELQPVRAVGASELPGCAELCAALGIR